MALPRPHHLGSCDLTTDPEEEFPVVVGSPTYVSGTRGNELRFANPGATGCYVETFGEFHGRYDGTSNEPTATGGNAFGAVCGFKVNVSTIGSGFVVLAAYLALVGHRQNELRLYSDGTLAVYRGGTLICASSAGAFSFGTDEYVEYRTLLDGWTFAGDNSSRMGHAGIRLNGTLLAQARAYVTGSVSQALNGAGVDYAQIGLCG